MRKINVIFLVLGSALLAYLVIEAGPANLWNQLGRMDWLFGVVVGAVLLSKVLMAVGWKYLLYADRTRANLWDLSLATFVGGAINDVTPGGVAGEPLKLTWLRGKVPGEDLVSSLILHNYLYMLTNVLLILAAGLYLVTAVELPAWAVGSAIAGMTIVVAGIVLLAVVIRLGLAENVLKILDRLHIRFRNADVLLEKARQADEQARSFYRERPGDLVKAFLWIAASRTVAAVENYFILVMLGHFVSPGTVLMITCMTVAVFVLFAFVPSQVGALEGGAYLLYPVLGLSAGLGVAVEVIRRLRILLLLGAGLALLAFRAAFKPVPTAVIRDALKPARDALEAGTRGSYSQRASAQSGKTFR